MSFKILYEPSSVRGDFGILSMQVTSPVTIPFVFTIQNKLTEEKLQIPPTDSVVFTFKQNVNSLQTVLKKTVTGLLDNTAVVDLSMNDLKLFKLGKNYVVGATWVDSNKKIVKTLIHQLPVVIDEGI